MTHLEGFRTVNVEQSEMKKGMHTWRYPDSELKKLENPKVKAFFLVNPSNPASVAIDPATLKNIVSIVKNKRPDLLLLTDDVYGTFVPGFRSLAAELPRNTILVYSYSKHFGCTGMRLGVIGIHQDNILDPAIARTAEEEARRAELPLLVADPASGGHEVHRPHGRRQPQRGTQPHGRPVAADAGADGAVLAVLAARQGRRLHAALPAHRAGAPRAAARRASESRSRTTRTAPPTTRCSTSRPGRGAPTATSSWNGRRRSTCRSTSSTGWRGTSAPCFSTATASAGRRGRPGCRSPTCRRTPTSRSAATSPPGPPTA